MNRCEQWAKIATWSVHRHHRAWQEIRAVTGKDVSAEQLAARRVDDEFDPPPAISNRSRLAGTSYVESPHLDLMAGFSRFWLGKTNARELRVGERRTGHYAVVGAPFGSIKHVGHGLRGLVGRNVREHEPPNRVADRIDVRHGCSQLGVDDDATRRQLDADLLQPEILNSRPTPRSNEHSVTLHDTTIPAVHSDPV